MGTNRSKWTPEEDRILRELIAKKASSTMMVVKLRRTAEAVRMRMIALRRKEKAPK